GAGGRERRTSDGGTTWVDNATAPGNTKPLTQVACPSSTVCYAVGDRGNAMKSTDGGATWSWLQSTASNPIYGLSCPTASVCYATDIYAHVIKTTNGGATWSWQQPPIITTTDGGATWTLRTSNAGSGNYLHGMSCVPLSTTCTAVGRGGTIVS